MFLFWDAGVFLGHEERRDSKAMNGEGKKDIALGAIALGLGVALGAVLGNEKTRRSLVDNGRNLLNNHRRKQK